MKINNYTLTYDPQSMEQTNTSLYSELQVPFGDNILLDMGGTSKKYDMDVILVDDEIRDIRGMIDGYKLIYIEFGDVEGFFYVTQFDLSWIKKSSKQEFASFKMSGYLSESSYLKIGSFSDNQKTDFDLTQTELISLPEYYVSKVSETSDYEITNTTQSGKHLLYFLDPEFDIKFKADKSLIKDGNIRVTKNGIRIYENDKSNYDMVVDTNLNTYTSLYNNASYILECKDYGGNNVYYLSDGLNSVLGTDTHISINPFRTTLKINHTTFLIKPNRNFIEILKSPQNITHTTKNIGFASKPDVAVGTKQLTTTTPAPLMFDRSIAAGTPPTEVIHTHSPLFVKHTLGDTSILGTFTTQANSHPYNGFYNGTERNYLLTSNTVPQFITSWTSSGFTSRTDGATYNGITNYMSSSTANSTLTSTLTVPYTGYYDIYIMASNYNTCPIGTYEFYIDSVLKVGTANLRWAITDTKANFVYLGNYFLNTGGNPHSFQIKLKTGKLGVFYLMAYPTNAFYTNESRKPPYEQIGTTFMDTNECYEVGE